MRYRLLGRSGVRVSELCLGAMVFGDERGGWGATREEAAAIVGSFSEAGGNFIDTANFYAGGESERIVGELIRPDRDRWVVGTKYALSSDRSDPNAGGTHRKSLHRSIDGSLERLGTDYIDLYWVHIWDAYTQVEEVVNALDDLVRAGKVLYLGISDTPAWIVSRAVTLAEQRGSTPFTALQVPYSLVERTVERELLRMARGLDLAVTGWAPLGGGLLTGRYGSDRERPTDTRLAAIGGKYEEEAVSERNLLVADALNEVAEARGATSSQVAIAWVRAQQHRAVTIPIVGTRTRAQLWTTSPLARSSSSAPSLRGSTKPVVLPPASLRTSAVPPWHTATRSSASMITASSLMRWSRSGGAAEGAQELKPIVDAHGIAEVRGDTRRR